MPPTFNYTEEELRSLGLTISTCKYEASIEAFAEKDLLQQHLKGGILFVGDSDIRLWTRNQIFEKAFEGLPVINRGFGGARTWEVLLYFDKLILPLQPKTIVYCCGDNDISNLHDKGASNAVLGFELFFKEVGERAPFIEKIIYLAIHPSPSDRALWHYIEAANQQLKEMCERYSKTYFFDYRSLLFKEETQTLVTENFLEDGLHFTDEFYYKLSSALKPLL